MQPPLLLQTCPAGQLLIPPNWQTPLMHILAGQPDVPHATPSLLFMKTQSPLQS
jgi:hypothetical protein